MQCNSILYCLFKSKKIYIFIPIGIIYVILLRLKINFIPFICVTILYVILVRLKKIFYLRFIFYILIQIIVIFSTSKLSMPLYLYCILLHLSLFYILESFYTLKQRLLNDTCELLVKKFPTQISFSHTISYNFIVASKTRLITIH